MLLKKNSETLAATLTPFGYVPKSDLLLVTMIIKSRFNYLFLTYYTNETLGQMHI